MNADYLDYEKKIIICVHLHESASYLLIVLETGEDHGAI